MGALDVKRMVDDRQWWRLISCIWLHAGVFHILANMLGLLFIGIRLEQEFGFSKFFTWLKPHAFDLCVCRPHSFSWNKLGIRIQ